MNPASAAISSPPSAASAGSGPAAMAAPWSASARSTTPTFTRERAVVDPGAAPGHVGGRPSGERRDQRGGRGGVADPHLARDEGSGPVRHELGGHLGADVERGRGLGDRHGRSGRQVVGPGRDLAAGEAGPRLERRRHPDVDDQHPRPGLAGQHVDGRAAGAEVGDHLGRDLLRPRRDPLGHDAVVAGEDRDRGRGGERWRARAGDAAQLRAERLEASERAGRLRQATVQRHRVRHGRGVRGPDAGQRGGERTRRPCSMARLLAVVRGPTLSRRGKPCTCTAPGPWPEGELANDVPVRPRDRSARRAEATAGHRGGDGHRAAPARALRRLGGQGQARRHRGAGRPAAGALRGRLGRHADAAGGGEDDHDGRVGPGLPPHRQEGDDRHPPAVDGPDVRDQGRRGRRRLQPGHPHGAAQPAPHRRLPRRDRGAQPAGRHPRQPPPPGQRPRPRPPQHHVAPRAGRQRSCAAQHRDRPRLEGGRRHPPERVRHHGRLGGDGRARPGHLARRT